MRISKRVKQIATIGVLVAGLVTSGCTSKQAPPPAVPEVATVTIKPERLVLTTELPGRTAPYRVAEIRPQVSGIVQKRLFEEGADVKEADLLYQIDPAPYQAACDNAKASLSRAQANVPAIRSRAERYKDLVETRAVSHQDYDDATAAIKQAEAEVEVWKASVESARINLGYTKVTAPISGRIGKSFITVGALATAHQASAFATIQQIDPLYVDAPQSSAELLALKRNLAAGRIKGSGDQARVKLFLEDRTVYPLEGTLKFSDVTVDPSTGSFILRMVFSNPKHILLPGMYVRAVVQEGECNEAILAPQQGVTRDVKGNPYALIVDAQGKVQQRALTLDRAIGDRWLVSSGLAQGDQVIVEGTEKVRPGDAVKAVPFQKKTTSIAATEKQAQPGEKSN